ncbi:hypothetical protein HARCEL1_06210 [Halococcoides cellulosivorans]|uniref:Uncharacterized protein n=1 Tax=Halococcoides cellulosivorans TaxID=1679096 RepID=A0A2R4X0K0_9EURY|nr:hypothetical protein HARCEL1_06210 [Halococcoides cellulosivorans]
MGETDRAAIKTVPFRSAYARSSGPLVFHGPPDRSCSTVLRTAQVAGRQSPTVSALDSARVVLRDLLGRGDDRPLTERVRDLDTGDRVIAIVGCEALSGDVRATRPDAAVIETSERPLVFAVEGDDVLAIERDPERLRGRVDTLDVL